MRTQKKGIKNYTPIFTHRFELVKVFGMLGQKDSFTAQKFIEQLGKLEKFVKNLIELNQAS